MLTTIIIQFTLTLRYKHIVTLSYDRETFIFSYYFMFYYALWSQLYLMSNDEVFLNDNTVSLNGYIYLYT